jgi:hypothetical protein
VKLSWETCKLGTVVFDGISRDPCAIGRVGERRIVTANLVLSVIQSVCGRNAAATHPVSGSSVWQQPDAGQPGQPQAVSEHWEQVSLLVHRRRPFLPRTGRDTLESLGRESPLITRRASRPQQRGWHGVAFPPSGCCQSSAPHVHSVCRPLIVGLSVSPSCAAEHSPPVKPLAPLP